MTNYLFTIQQIMKKYYEFNKKSEFHNMIFIDFKLAYESINRDKL